MNDTVPKTHTEIQLSLENKMIEVLHRFETHYKREMPIPRISVESDLGLKLGCANKVKNLIKIHRGLCNEKHWNEILNQVLPHEVSHLVAPLIYNHYRHGHDKHEGWGHGRAWKECMRVLGLQPDRTHDLDMETTNTIRLRTVKREFVYGCPCGKQFNLTAILHKHIQAGRDRKCLKCMGKVTFMGMKA